MEKLSINNAFSFLRIYVNGCLCDKEPWQIVTITTTAVLSSICLWQFIFEDDSLSNRAKKTFFKLAKKIPAVKRKVQNEIDTISIKFNSEAEKRAKEVPYITSLPQTGWSDKEILSHLDKCLALGDYDWKDGNVSGAVYFKDSQLAELMGKVYALTAYTNPLHPDIFPGVNKMEAEVVRLTANLFHGGDKACGTMTSGGTESIMMACKALRDYGLETRGIRRGEIVLPTTAHPAFDKAALYLGMRITHVPVDPVTFTVDIRQMRRAISRNTVMLVGSVPNYPYGTADDIEAIAALGRKYNIPVHVDCCLGGFLTAFMPAAGFTLPPFDFAVSGVVSISVDPHKYGYTPKGASVVLYKEGKYRHHQYTVTTDWPGGVYASPTVNGSRPGGTIAVCWASIMHFGLEGYLLATKKIITTTRYIEEKLKEIEELYMFGKAATSVVAFGSKQFHIYKLSEMLMAKGWNLSTLQFPCGIHLAVTQLHTEPGVADRLITDIRSAVTLIMNSPDPQDMSKGKVAVYGMAQAVPDRSIVGDILCSFIDSLYFTPSDSKLANGNS